MSAVRRLLDLLRVWFRLKPVDQRTLVEVGRKLLGSARLPFIVVRPERRP